MSNLNGKFTVTIASPAVFTKLQHGLQAGYTVSFATTGNLPTGLSTGTNYYVISTGLTADLFRVSSALNGSAIDTSGLQSGLHSLSVTSFGQSTSKSYGTAVIQDGTYVYSDPPYPGKRTGFVSYSDFRDELSPKFLPKPSGLKTFVVDLKYAESKYVYREGRSPSSTNIPVSYSKQYKRVSSGRNVVGDLKSFVSQFSGCDEAHKLRKRIIALTGLRGSVSSETFRFGIGDQT